MYGVEAGCRVKGLEDRNSLVTLYRKPPFHYQADQISCVLEVYRPMQRIPDGPWSSRSLFDRHALYQYVSSRWTASQIVLLCILSAALIAGALGELKESIFTVEVLVLAPDGEPADVAQLTLWREAAPSTAAEVRSGGPLRTIHWHDKETDTVWIPTQHQQTAHTTTYENLDPGRYRVSAASVHPERSDPTPYGLSEVIALDNAHRKTSVTIRQQGDTPLRVVVIDEKSNAAIAGAAVTLYREDGLPVGFGSGNFISRTDENGGIEFHRLTPGRYTITAQRIAHRYGQQNYPEVKQYPVDVIANRQNPIRMPLRSVPLSDEEVDRRWPFIVTGRVTDTGNNPLKDVKISAHCGVGTLMPTGETRTDSHGRYTLRFTGGMWFVDEETGERRIGLQAATIHAHLSGYYETNLWRHGGLAIADERRDEGELEWYADLVLPLTPYALDFVMTPAAHIEGIVLTSDGKPMAGMQVWLSGDRLPPSCSVMASAETRANGQFTITEVPCKPFWFEVRNESGEEVRTEPFRFDAPGIYKVQLNYSDGVFQSPEIGCVITRP